MQKYIFFFFFLIEKIYLLKLIEVIYKKREREE
jgi:hypothetical protein